MFIDPLTLFIVGEILVVYIIINVFLFYKSRLYNVLLALLKEMRFEKLRREQLKQKELALLRAKNKDLVAKNEAIVEQAKSAGKTIPEQLEERIAVLNEKYPNAKDLTNSVELGESTQWLRVRILELEQELLSGNIDEDTWQELATEAISRLKVKEADELLNTENRKDGAEDSRYTGQLENDLEEAQRLFNDAKIKINQLESELEEIKTISTPSESHLETPESGIYEEEVYRLKCDNFDLHESINKLKLELQQIDPSIDSDTYLALLENQISNMEQYIKSADIASGLMEKEISAYKKQIEDLQAELGNLGTASDTVSLQPLKSLSKQQEEQTDTLSSMKDTIERLKAGEDIDAIASDQEQHISRLEQIIKESEQCIHILESELTQSTDDVHELQKQLADKKAQILNSRLGDLSNVQNGQKEGIGNIKTIIEDIKAGGDSDELIDKHEQEITKLEHFLAESDTLIGQLEAEITDLNAQLLSGPDTQADEQSTRPNTTEDILEMETLLQQFIGDIQSLMRMINKLEDENTGLRNHLSDEKGSSNNTADQPSEPPVMIDVEPIEEPNDL